ncbi:MAG: hypothetical protein ACOVLG_10405 [Flavobacterium sp.]|jgi:hypothetical protein|uniref:hypothetical protein n=1 Tax=Flavobacterium sp. TaxID=239 RepID=UPI000ACD9CC6|nr:hypothetical protein [Flavobacterium sp.]
MNKNEIIKSIINEQNVVISTIENSVSRYKNASDIDENDSIDPEDFSHQDEAKEMQLRYEQILVQAKNNLDFLETYKNKETTKIELGSLIETEDLYIFIGISLQQFKLNGKNVIAISEEAPIYNSIKEKTIGEKITIGTIENTIISIS